MHSSDTPENDRDEREAGPQGPADWSDETPSDDRLDDEARRRLEQDVQRDVADVDEDEDEIVDEP